MINLFLKAKHWHIFMLTFGVIFLFQVFFMFTMFASVFTSSTPDVFNMISNFIYIFIVFFILILISSFFTYGWQWSVVIGLKKLIPQNITFKMWKFKVFFFFPIVYMSLFFLFIGFLLNYSQILPELFDSNQIFIGILCMIPFHLFSIFCFYYCMYFTAKIIKTAEIQKEVSFSEFALEFIFIWFFQIGIWFLQPRINKLAKENFNTQAIN